MKFVVKFEENMKTNRKNNIVLLSVIVIIVIAIIITVGRLIIPFSSYNPTPVSNPKENPVKTETGVTSPKTNPPVQYNQNGQQQLLNKFENRPKLSASDQSAKARLLSLLPQGEQSGTLYQTTEFAVDYVHSADLFQVEIRTTSVDQAKTDADNWFLNKGMSQQGICNLPVQFYLSFTVLNQLRGSNIVFNPLAPFCQ